ncbi:hypothetical protein [Sphingopyxis sp.]|uniref:hypothetical protein n=1 Tax=Sphingopyxis sp. TaxID=1908224 RepID=UPI0026091118|nr:hypothetical protein [Sphingopyxis sp.]MCW0198561.1 hypothetical protein [Sphingopyxis sp.]
MAEIDGALYPLLSIGENSNGRLILKPKKSKFNIQDGIWRETIEQKITVHPPSDSGNNTIHHTIRTNGSSDIETYQVTSAVKNGGLCLIYAHTFGDLTLSNPSSLIRKNDRVYKIAKFYPKKSVLHMLVFISSSDSTINFIDEDKNYNRYIINFSNVSVIIVTTFTYMPSLVEGWLMHFATAPPRVGGKFFGEPFAPTDGLSPQEARGVAGMQLIRSHLYVHERAKAFLASCAHNDEVSFDPALEEAIRWSLALSFRSTPIIPSDDGRARSQA